MRRWNAPVYGLLCGLTGCIQPNPDYLGQASSSGGMASTTGRTTAGSVATTMVATSSSGATSDSGTSLETSDAATDDASSSGEERTTGGITPSCSGRGGFCYLAPVCTTTQVEAARSAVADFDSDGDLDVVVVGRGPDGLEGLSNDGDGALAPAFFAETGARPEDVAIVDLDNFGAPELVVAARDANLVQVFSLVAGRLTAPTEYDPGNRPMALALADVAGDPRTDVVVALRDENAFVILEAQPDGALLVHEPHPVAERPADVVVGDIDGDGALDVVTANDEGGSLSVSFGAQDGTFEDAVTTELAAMTTGVTTLDLDGGAGLDLAAVAESVDGVSLLTSMGTTLGPPVTIPAGLEPHEVLAGDFNDDGVADLAVAHVGEASLYVFAGQGDGTFGVPLNIALSADGFGVTSGDLNGDEIPDLVASAPDVGQICVVLSSRPR